MIAESVAIGFSIGVILTSLVLLTAHSVNLKETALIREHRDDLKTELTALKNLTRDDSVKLEKIQDILDGEDDE